MTPPPIVAICLVKNEDLWFGQALANIRDFVDQIVVIDTGSTDGTLEIATRAGAKIKRVDDLRQTHDVVETYFQWKMGWLFGVDGDELYDPVGLKRVRWAINEGLFRAVFQIETCFFHATKIERRGSECTATGYHAPPSRAPSKLYNLELVQDWPSDGHGTLFHSKTRTLAPGCVHRDPSYQVKGWDGSPLRCLHTRFLTRSTLEKSGGRRANPEDIVRGKKRNDRKAYQKGPLDTVDASPFFQLTPR